MANEPRRILEQPALSVGGFTPSTIPKTSSYFALDVAGGKTHRMTPEEVVAFLNSEGLSVADADYTVSGIVERATQLEVNNGSGSGSTTAPLFVSPPELTTYVQNYVSTYVTNNAPQIAASAETTLNNAGDFFDFDTSALTPPVVGRKVIPVVLEKGTAGGELFAQENQYNQNYGVSAFAKHVSSVEANGIIYSMSYDPAATKGFLKINPQNKSSEFVTKSYASNLYGPGAYDPATNKICFVRNGGANPYLIFLRLEDESINEVNINGVAGRDDAYNSIIRHPNGKGYAFPFSYSTAVNKILEIDYQTETAITVGDDVGATSPFISMALTFEGNFIYAFPRQDTGGIWKYEIGGSSPNPTRISTGGLRGFGRGVRFGNKYYASPRYSARIGVFDLLTETFSTVTIPGLGTTVEVSNEYNDAAIRGDKIIFIPTNASGFIEFDPSNDSFRILGSSTGLRGASYNQILDTITTVPRTNDRPTDYIFENGVFFSPINPEPYFSVSNLFTSSGNINRLASSEDYNIDITEDGSGNITNIRVTMLTEGTKDVTLNLVYAGF